MTSADDDVLKRELGKLGALGGGLGGAASGGALGARFAAGRLPTETFSARVELDAPAERVLAAAYGILASLGRILREAEGEDSRYPRLSAVVGSGFLRLNPTVVHLEVTGAEGTRCSATLTGLAKEGLIKQRSAEKAVARLQQELQRALARP